MVNIIMDAVKWYKNRDDDAQFHFLRTQTGATVALCRTNRSQKPCLPFQSAPATYFAENATLASNRQVECSEDFTTRQFEGFDGAFDEIRFKGPETIKGLNELRNKESWEILKKDVSNHYFGPDKNFFHLPRHILCSKHEYIMESMEKKDTKAELGDESFDFHLDPNRVRTDAEIQLFADVFSISREEARRIITEAGFRCAT